MDKWWCFGDHKKTGRDGGCFEKKIGRDSMSDGFFRFTAMAIRKCGELNNLTNKNREV